MNNLGLKDQIRKHLLKQGDILVAAKGNDNFAVVCKGMLEYAVASSMFMILKIKEVDKVLPEYLAWFINHPETQNLLRITSKGTSFPSITKSDIEEIILPLPSIKKQKHLVHLDELFQRQIQLKKNIISLNEKLFQHQLINALK
jgi:restriction endonuclease S subunit